MFASGIILFGLVSIVFLSAALIGLALAMRGQWEKLRPKDGSGREQ
jgi:hypothetical protein